MTTLRNEMPLTLPWLARLPLYYGWINLIVASLAMVGTLPGRTQGLGLITESLLKDLQVSRVTFAQINLWATLIGALGCLGIGKLIDRFGSRIVLTVVVVALGLTVWLMSNVSNAIALGLLITLTRGFGQSALSVVSITMVGQWFVKRLSAAMASYTVLLSVGFMIAFPVVGAAVVNSGWRATWLGIAVALLCVFAPLCWWLVRESPEACGVALDGKAEDEQSTATDFTLRQAMATPTFWVFALSSSFYGLIASGIALFNESILAELGFAPTVYHNSLAITAITALAGNFLGGWLTTKWSMNRLMALAMSLLALSLLALPHLRSFTHVALYAVVMGVAGGFVMVIFFSYWSRAYGRAHLGQIQGAAQSLTVLASAIGPLLLAECVTRTGSYAVIFRLLAVVVAALAISAWGLKKNY